MTARAGALDLDGGVAPFPGWAVVEVTGRDRERFLASQVTSDVAAIAAGDSRLSALLDRSGRLQAFFFVCKRADSIELLIPEAVVDHCVDRLGRHVIADDVVIGRRRTGAMRLVIGPAAAALPVHDECIPVEGWGTRGFVTWSAREIPFAAIDPDELEARRMLGGPSAWGREVRPDQLINETSLLETAVAFDKGCYLGQETVTKVASHRGAVRGAVLIELAEPRVDSAGLVGADFQVGDRTRAGEVLSTARWSGRVWLQVSLHRDLRVIGRELHCVFADGSSVDGVIRSLPLLPPPSREDIARRLTVAASEAFSGDRTERAIELLERAIEICPSWADAFESLGVILGRLGRYPEAVEQMRRLLEVDPSSVMAHSNLSLFFNRLGDIEQAERHLALATRASFSGASTDPDESRGRDQAEALDADRRRREEMFRQVLEIDPDDAVAHFGLGGLAIERERYAEAVAHLEKAIAADPTHTAARLALGRGFENLGDERRALEVYTEGVAVAARRGDGAAAQKMQERLTALRAR